MLEVNNISLSFNQNAVLQDLSFVLKKGEIACILGASGCGKTSLLRTIAGLVQQQAGEVSIAEQVVSDANCHWPVQDRNVGLVFQDFALFPHLTVVQNVAYGLRINNKAKRLQEAMHFVQLVGLEGQENKYPYQLSGGQQQRVALARAIAPHPDVLLLDEPFSSLDPELREHLAIEVRSIIKQQNITALMITHDQSEAFGIADKVGIMHKGVIQQWDTPYNIYHQPRSAYIASFIGESTFLSGTVEKLTDSSRVITALGRFMLPDGEAYTNGQLVSLLVRPDDIVHVDSSEHKAKVVARAFRGAHILYKLQVGSSQEWVYCLAPSHHDHQVGESFGIHLHLDHVICFSQS